MRNLKFKRRFKSPFFERKSIQSATEQTGLLQTIPEDDSQAESYERLYPIHRQKPKR